MNHTAAFKALFTTESVAKGAWYYDQVAKSQHTQTPEIQEMDALALKMSVAVSRWIIQGDLNYSFGQNMKNFSIKNKNKMSASYINLATAVLHKYSIYDKGDCDGVRLFLYAFSKTEYLYNAEVYNFGKAGDNFTGKDYLIKILLVKKKEKTDAEKRAEIQKNVAEALKKRAEAEAEVEPNPMRICYCGCGTQAKKMLKTSSKCGARYVNAEHQIAAWKDHKAKCETCRVYVKN